MANTVRTAYSELRRLSLLPLLWWGMAGALFISFASWGAGAKYAVNSWLVPLHLDWLRYGHGQLLCQVLFWLGILLLVINWVRLGAFLLDNDQRALLSAPAIGLIAVVWMVPFLIAGPILSRDVFSYLAQGAIQHAGSSAYQVGPNILNEPGHVDPLYLEVSADWRNTTTPYGPLHLGLMELIIIITHNNIHAGVFLVKLLCMLSMVGIMWGAQTIARSLGTSPVWAIWFAGVNPLMLLHLVGGMHNEAFMVALMVVGLALSLRRQHLLGITVITLGAAIKATAFVALPFLIWIWVAHLRAAGKTQQTTAPGNIPDAAAAVESRGKLVGYFLATAAGGAVLSVAIFAAVSFTTGTGLGFLAALQGSGKVINWLAFPTALAHFTAMVSSHSGGPSFTVTLGAARSIFSIVMGLLVILVWAHYRKTPLQALRGLAIGFLVLCFFNSLAFPWYYSWILGFVGALALSRRAIRIIAAFCAWGCVIVLPYGIIGLYNYFWASAALVVGVTVYWFLGRGEHTWPLTAATLPISERPAGATACGAEDAPSTTPLPAPGA